MILLPEKAPSTNSDSLSFVEPPPPYDDVPSSSSCLSDRTVVDDIKDPAPSSPAPSSPFEPANPNSITPRWRPSAPACWMYYEPVSGLIIYLCALGYSFVQAQRIAYKWKHGSVDLNEVPEEWGGLKKRERKQGCCGEKDREGCCGQRKSRCGTSKTKGCF